MPRVSEAEKQKSHARIIEAAACLFRSKGIGETSISDVMVAAGLTHGGFYRHFGSKEELVEAAFLKAVDGMIADIVDANDPAARASKVAAFFAQYLSLDHVKTAQSGCPFAAMGAEVARIGGGSQGAASKAIHQTVSALQDEANSGAQGIGTLATLIGTITLARLADTDAAARHIIEAGTHAVNQIRNP